MVLNEIVSLDECDSPLELADLPIPEPKHREVLIRVWACGVCHKELDEIEGRTAPPKLPVVPGHEVAAAIPIRPEVTTYPLRDANKALAELRRGQIIGAKVLIVNDQ